MERRAACGDRNVLRRIAIDAARVTERLLLQYRVAFGLVLLGIVLGIGIVVRSWIKIHALGANPTRMAVTATLAGGRAYVDVAVVVIVLGMILGVVTTLQSQPSKRSRP